MSDRDPLPPAMCEALQSLLRPPHDPVAAQALADALHRLLPEARVAYLLGTRFQALSPRDAPAELRPPLTSSEGGRWSHDGLSFHGTDTPIGTLGVAVPGEAVEVVRPRLRLAAALVEAGWRAAVHDHPQTRELLTLGEAAGGLLHALNNQLNGVVMNAALLQAQAPEALRERAAAIRRQGVEAARQALPAQAVRPWPGVEGETACPYTAFTEARHESGDERLSVAVIGEGPVGPVPASPLGLRRLFGLMIRIARACVGGEVDLCGFLTPGPAGQFFLRLPDVRAERDEKGNALLPPSATPFKELQRQAAAWLARKQGTRLEVVAVAGGLELRLAWPPPAGIA